MKRFILVFLVITVIFTASACTGKKKEVNADVTTQISSVTGTQGSGITGTKQETTLENDSESSEKGNGENSTGIPEGDVQLLQSASVDLDADGVNEEVEAYQLKIKGEESDPGELEGYLKITDGNAFSEVSFIKKQAGLSGVMSGFQFEDLDGDGAKDIFLTIPDNGAAFSLNYYFAYSYKKEREYSFTTDSSLSELANSFVFTYLGGGKLEIKKDSPAFAATFNISDSSGFEKDEESNSSYQSSWVEPTPVEISENSRIGLIKTSEGKNEIKVPLPVFGRATVDMIGEVDLIFGMNSDFVPELSRFEVLDFSNDGTKKIGEWKK